MTPRARALLVTALVAGTLAVPFVLGQHGGFVAGLFDVLHEPEYPAPPTLNLTSPQPGEGASGGVRLVGEARSASGVVVDVQARVDGGSWASLPEAPRGQPVSAFESHVPLAPGDHVIEARAFDGEAFSLPARALVRIGTPAPPTVRIHAPGDASGVAAGPVLVSGSVTSEKDVLVLVEADGHVVEATLLGPARSGVATWRASLELPAGAHVIRATAVGAAISLPAEARVVAAPTPPPTLRVLHPQPGASFGSSGDPACPSGCLAFAGTLSAPASAVLASLDGGAPVTTSLDAPVLLAQNAGPAWSWSLGVARLYAGAHHVTFTPVALDGTHGASVDVDVLVRTARSFRLAGEDAPRTTGTPIAFRMDAPGLAPGRWLLDGEPIAQGSSVSLSLATPGAHVLSAEARDAQGRLATAALPLFALNRAPLAALPLPSLDSPTLRFVSASEDLDGRIVEHRWSFGDGANVTTPEDNVTHHYASAGVYRVELVVVDDQGAASAPATLLVPIANGAPLPAFTWMPREPSTLDAVTFQDASRDPEGRLAAWTWRVDDGTNLSGEAPTHRFATRGDHAVTLEVMDEEGLGVSLTQLVHVRNLPAEVAFVHEPTLLRTGEEAVFMDVSRKLDGALVSARWDFGHHDACGAAACNSTRARFAAGGTVVHVFPEPADYNVTLTVIDDLGEAWSRVIPVRVLDAAPRVQAVTLEPPEPRAFDVVRFGAVALDAEGDVGRLVWEFGDNATADEPAPLHRYVRSGVYQAKVTAYDAAGQSVEFPFLVRVGNAPPDATLEAPLGRFAGFATLLVANASDPDGRLVRYTFDADGDRIPDCDGDSPKCVFHYASVGTYAASVRVEDDEGGNATAALLVDVLAPPSGLAPPTVLVEAPVPGSTLKGSFLLVGRVEGVRNLTRVDLQLRQGPWSLSAGADAWTPVDGLDAWRLLLDTRRFPDGEYDLVVRAQDEGGAMGLATVPIRVANGPAPNEVTLRILQAPEEPVTESFTLTGSAWHPGGITSVRWRVDDGPWRAAEGDPLAFRVPLDARALSAGEHVLRVSAHRGTEESAEALVTFRAQPAPPRLLVDEAPTPVAYGLLRAAGRLDGDGRALWRLDNGVWREAPGGARWRLDLDTTAFANGPHTFSLKAVSANGADAGPARDYPIRILNPLVENVDPPVTNEVDLAKLAEGKQVPLGLLAPLALLVAAVAWRRFAPPRQGF